MDTAEQNQSEDLQDLEKAFQEEAMSVPTPEPSKDSATVVQTGFSNTKQKLSETNTKIAEKVVLLKKEAKDSLGKLKELKTSIAKKIADIKELEETQEKIKKELEKISGLEVEVKSITDEAKHELGEI
jgi:hypothetical protein